MRLPDIQLSSGESMNFHEKLANTSWGINIICYTTSKIWLFSSNEIIEGIIILTMLS